MKKPLECYPSVKCPPLGVDCEDTYRWALASITMGPWPMGWSCWADIAVHYCNEYPVLLTISNDRGGVAKYRGGDWAALHLHESMVPFGSDKKGDPLVIMKNRNALLTLLVGANGDLQHASGVLEKVTELSMRDVLMFNISHKLG
jgi:hypothetical protein